jgi:hypothetical protein
MQKGDLRNMGIQVTFIHLKHQIPEELVKKWEIKFKIRKEGCIPFETNEEEPF